MVVFVVLANTVVDEVEKRVSTAQRIQEHGIVAVVRLDDLAGAVPLTEALVAGGVRAVEFTFTNPKAAHAIEATKAAVGERGFIGAGTVLDPETARAAILAGAEYIVTPTYKRETIELCNRYGVPTVIGAFTATEMLTAWEAGASYIKVHPASLGGPRYFKDILGPLPQLKLIPSGGVSLDNAADFIRAGAVAVALGGNLVDQKTVAAGDWTTLTERAHRLSEAVVAARNG
jgi:2-dehydro-3-deoxyphosphogluconate aldolase / (4S)-4-hydroxy-2-oxoglutarate aldolase